MNYRETEILDDLEAWRNAKLPKIHQGDYLSISEGQAVGSCALIRVAAGKYARDTAEPEMAEALAKLCEAVKGLEPARQKIIERKLYELRLVGMRGPEATP